MAFQPGQSGNPAGRPRAAATSAPWTAKPTPAPSLKILRCVRSSSSRRSKAYLPSVLVQTFLSYAFGKPVEVVDVGDGDSPTRTIQITF